MVGWIIWSIIFITILFQTASLITKYKFNEAVRWKDLVMICSGWIVLLIFLFKKIDKLHILWVYALVWLVVSTIAWQRSKNKKGGEDWIRLR